MSNDFVSEPGSRPIDEIGVEIHDQTKQVNDNNATKGQHPDCPSKFINFLRIKLAPKGADQTETQLKKEEVSAYKDLLVSLESVPKERGPRSWNGVKISINVVLLVVFVALLVTTRSVHEVNDKLILHLRIHRWVALIMVIVSGLPSIQFITLVASEPMVWFRKTSRYALYFAWEIKKSVDVMLWFLLVLGVWYTWFRPEIVKDTRGAKTLRIPIPQYEDAVKMGVKQVTRLLMALTLGALLWTLKVILYLRLHANLHYKELCIMIRQTILELHAIQFLINNGEIKHWSFLKEDESNEKETKIFWMNVSNLRKGRAPIWILKNLCGLYMVHMKRKKPEILSDLDPTTDDDKFTEKAKDLYKAFMNIKNDKRPDFITESDIKDFGLQRKELDFVFKMFNSRDQEHITEDQFLRWAVRALKGCLRLERIIVNSRRIFMKLNMWMSACVVVLVIVIWLLISEIITTAQLAVLFAPLVSAGFIFGESLKRTFDGLIFVFGMHPFDVDQRVLIDNVKMRVTEVRLLTTVFFGYETGDEIIYPNSVLSTKSITKVDLTKNMPDSVEFTVPVDTPEELICDLGVKIKKSLDDELAFTCDTTVVKKEITETSFTLIVHFKYLVAYHSPEIKDRHRSKILETIVRFREEMKRVHEREKAIEKEKDEYEAEDAVKFRVDCIKKLEEIELIKKNIVEILQGCRSSKDCSKVLFAGIDQERIDIAVYIRHRKDMLKHTVKEDLKQKIQRVIDRHCCPHQNI